MRIIAIILSILFLIFFDCVTKVNMDDFAWHDQCYQGSPAIVQDSYSWLKGYCYSDTRTGQDFYESVSKDGYSPIIWEYLGFQLSYNPGIAFSLPITGLPLQIITIGLVLALLGYYFRIEYPKKSKLLDVGYILIIAGALSHAYERIAVGYVIDFISVKYFAILNFADIFISIGAALLFIAYYARKQ